MESFNPRARVGRDMKLQLLRINDRQFQSTRPRGARLILNLPTILRLKFQSTRPRGARPLFWRAEQPFGRSFNPRARVGRDAI